MAGVTGVTRVDLALPYMPHQAKIVDDFLAGPGYGYIGAEQGTGKSIVGVGIAASAVEAGEYPVLLVVPPSMRISWMREFTRFAPWLKMQDIRGIPTTQEWNQAHVYLIGDSMVYSGFKPERGVPYDRTRLVAPALMPLYGHVKCLIIDEAQRFKNDSWRARAMRVFADSVKP